MTDAHFTDARDSEIRVTGRRRWGWALLLLAAGLVVLNGVGWWFYGGSLATFEADTGVPLEAFRAAYPSVASSIAWEHRHVAVWFTGFGLMALLLALDGWRGGRTSWRASWLLPLTLLALAAGALAPGELGFGLFLLAMALCALVGQLLAAP